jgi:protein transport protein SEC24
VPPPVSDFGEMGPIRCQRCRAYISAFFEFIDGGQAYRCPFCRTSTPVQQPYFAHLDCNGRRTDIDYRTELRLGSYEVVATKQYCENNILPNEPAFIFLIDVSYQSVNSGLLDLLCTNLPDLLENLPR